MINEKINCELVEWPLICRDLYEHRWMGVQMPPLTSENSHLLWSGSQGAALVMRPHVHLLDLGKIVILETIALWWGGSFGFVSAPWEEILLVDRQAVDLVINLLWPAKELSRVTEAEHGQLSFYSFIYLFIYFKGTGSRTTCRWIVLFPQLLTRLDNVVGHETIRVIWLILAVVCFTDLLAARWESIWLPLMCWWYREPVCLHHFLLLTKDKLL